MLYTHMYVCVCVRVFHAHKILGFLNPQTAMWDKEYLPEESAHWMIQIWFFHPPVEAVLPRGAGTSSSHLQPQDASPVKYGYYVSVRKVKDP